MQRHPAITDLVARFPVGDERFNPVPLGNSVIDQRTSDVPDYAPLFRGPFVITFVDSRLDRALYIATCVRYDDRAGKAFIDGIATDRERPLRIYPGTVTPPTPDGAFIVENTHQWNLKPGVMVQFRPLTLDDHEWMGVPRQDDLATLGLLWTSATEF